MDNSDREVCQPSPSRRGDQTQKIVSRHWTYRHWTEYGTMIVSKLPGHGMLVSVQSWRMEGKSLSSLISLCRSYWATDILHYDWHLYLAAKCFLNLMVQFVKKDRLNCIFDVCIIWYLVILLCVTVMSVLLFVARCIHMFINISVNDDAVSVDWFTVSKSNDKYENG